MKLFFTVTKKSLVIILCAMIVTFIGIMWLSSIQASAIDGATHANRMLYINSLGVTIDEKNCSMKETIIPESFSEVYENYNKLQLEAGFDLKEFKGKRVTVYSYPIVGNNKILTLLVFNDTIIGGDIAEAELGGKMVPLGK